MSPHLGSLTSEGPAKMGAVIASRTQALREAHPVKESWWKVW